MTRNFVAVDLGASSGRVMLGRVTEGSMTLDEVARFPNTPLRLGGSLHWNVTALYQGILDGLRTVAESLDGEPLESIGIDTWAVDYGLIARDGSLLGVPYHYRDDRTVGAAARVAVSEQELYARTGIAQLPFNTVYQLVSELPERLGQASTMLMMPDLLAYWLTGRQCGEVTNASSTGLLDPHTRDWDRELVNQVGLDPSLLPALAEPGTVIGPLRPDIGAELGLSGDVTVVAVGTHDTASAVVAVPADGTRFAYIASGTWSLVGVELPAPVLTEAARTAGFTNEAGIDGTTRLLRNVMGLWLVQESLRQWSTDGLDVTLAELLDDAATLNDLGSVVDPDLPVFLPPGDMPARLADECARTGQHVPTSPAEVIRCIMDSLAGAYQRSVRAASDLAGFDIDTIHIVGGGSQNALLCQLTADATGLPVIAGPVEGSALGNILVQARAAGAVGSEPGDLRSVVRESFPVVRYRPCAPFTGP